MDFNLVLQSIWGFQNQVMGLALDQWLMIFCRILAFSQFAPILSRKDVVFQAKLGFVIFLTTLFLFILPAPSVGQGIASGAEIGGVLILMLMNITVGAFLGFIIRMVVEVGTCAGALITNQIGLQAANILDPTTRQQNMLLGPPFNFLASLLFLEIGGLGWLVEGLHKSFELFPLFSAPWNVMGQIPIDYLIHISSEVISIGLLIAGPFFLVTMTVDIMLGIVNRIAQQIPVFQQSFAIKPAVGVFIFWLVLPSILLTLMNFMNNYKIFF